MTTFVTLDLETYYADDYSLSAKGKNAITMEEYINDPRFLLHGIGIKVNDSPSRWYTRRQFEKNLGGFRTIFSGAVCVAQNAPFDMAILAWHYGCQFGLIADTLSMARPIHGVDAGGSLDYLVRKYGLGQKGRELVDFKNKRDLTPEEYAILGNYCKNDVDLTWELWKKLRVGFPKEELAVIDTTIRMYVEPVFKANVDRLKVYHHKELNTKQMFLDKLQKNEKELGSNEVFAEILRGLGVEPPTKFSVKQKKEVYAFAKSDAEFKALLDHPNDFVKLAVEARLNVKSTLGETRSLRLIQVAERNGGRIPNPKKYCGAHTLRFSGSEKLNLENLPRGGELRASVEAPEGYVLVAADSANIEARVLPWIAGQQDLIEQFILQDKGLGKDVYSNMATKIYGREVDRKKNPDDFIPGFVGKATILGCLAGDQLVLTNRGQIPIDKIKLSDRLWDGENWVSHEGLIYKGYKDVITYAGLTATPDHIVYLRDGSECSFGDAAEKNYKIAITGIGGDAIRFTKDNQYGYSKAKQTHLFESAVQMWSRRLGAQRRFSSGEFKPMSDMYGGTESDIQKFYNIRQTVRRYSCEVYKTQLQRLRTLWSERYSERVLIKIGVYTICRGEFTARRLSWVRDRSHRQQWELCPRQLAPCDTFSEYAKQEEYQSYYTWKKANNSFRCDELDTRTASRNQVRAFTYNKLVKEKKTYCGASNRKVESRRKGKEKIIRALQRYTDSTGRMGKKVTLSIQESPVQRIIKTVDPREPKRGTPCKKAHVYDILNSGPNHRFTVSGKLVHNCGFGLGWPKFQGMIRTGMLGQKGVLFDQPFVDAMEVQVDWFLNDAYNLQRTEECYKTWDTWEVHATHCAVAKKIIDEYRGSVPKITQLWKFLNDTILPAVHTGANITFGPNDIFTTAKDTIRTPSGFCLHYPNLRQIRDPKTNKLQWVYDGRNGKMTGTWGGALTENLVQHIARLVLTYQMTLVAKEYKIATTTHDEIVAVVPEDEAKEACEWIVDQMRKTKPWMAGLPVNAEGNFGKTYKDCK